MKILGAKLGVASRKVGRQAFRKLPRELTEQDLENPAVPKLLLNEIDRLEIENEEHKHYMERFHEADKKVAVLEEKGKTILALDISFGGCLTIGALILGQVLPLWSQGPFGWLAIYSRVHLAIVAKKVKAS